MAPDQARRRFAFRFTGINRWMWLIGIRRARCYVEVGEDTLAVYFGWAFRLHAPLSSVPACSPDDRPVRAWGAHGWRGRWLVNGSSSGVVRIDLVPPVRARSLFLVPRVHELRLSLDDPDGFVAWFTESTSVR